MRATLTQQALKALILILFSASLSAAPKALSLEQALQAVREHNPDVAAAQAGAEAARGMALAAHAWMPPRLELELMGMQWPSPDSGQWMERRLGVTQELPF